VGVLHLGPERTEVPYEDPRRADKLVLLDRINRDRAAHGVPPVRYEPRASLAGDLFCLDAALTGSWGHWDVQGRAPYLRWALAGGVDFHAENAASYSVSDGHIRRPVADILLEVHDRMMAEQPPLDGHRRTFLDPGHTHVGIGVAMVGGEFRMTEEFTRAVFEWIEIPDRPLRAGQRARVAGRPPAGWEVGLVEVRHEPPPRPLTLAELKERGGYAYPPVWRTLRPRPAWGAARLGSDPPGFQADRDRVTVTFPLAAGPGHYYVLCYLRPAHAGGDPMIPATGALVTALP
jgi:hypothetical protein